MNNMFLQDIYRLYQENDDPPIKGLPKRKPMWEENISSVSDATSVKTPPVSSPKTYDDFNPQGNKYFNSQGNVRTDWSGKNDVRYNAKVDNQLKEDYDNQGLKDLGELALRIGSDAIDAGMSGLDYANGKISLAELGLGILPMLNPTVLRKLTGRVLTNVVKPEGYTNKFEDLKTAFSKENYKETFQAIKNDTPIYQSDYPRDFAYRTQFDLEPRTQYIDKENNRVSFEKRIGFEEVPKPIKQSDGTYSLESQKEDIKKAFYRTTVGDNFFSSNPTSQNEFDLTQKQNIPISGSGPYRDAVMGGYSGDWNPVTGDFIAKDNWDYGLHPQEKEKLIDMLLHPNTWDEVNKKYIKSSLQRILLDKFVTPVTFSTKVNVKDFGMVEKQTLDMKIYDDLAPLIKKRKFENLLQNSNDFLRRLQDLNSK